MINFSVNMSQILHRCLDFCLATLMNGQLLIVPLEMLNSMKMTLGVTPNVRAPSTMC